MARASVKHCTTSVLAKTKAKKRKKRLSAKSKPPADGSRRSVTIFINKSADQSSSDARFQPDALRSGPHILVASATIEISVQISCLGSLVADTTRIITNGGRWLKKPLLIHLAANASKTTAALIGHIEMEHYRPCTFLLLAN